MLLITDACFSGSVFKTRGLKDGAPKVIQEMDEKISRKLIELNEIYSEMGQKCRTDFNPHHHRDNEILNILECQGKMMYYELDKEWHYSESDRTWRFTNEKSSYRMRQLGKNNKVMDIPFHVR